MTGGGIAANLARVIPEGMQAELQRSTWSPAPIFRTIQRTGRVPQEEMEKTFNMGVGMVAVVAEDDAERAMAMLTARHVEAWKLGEVHATEDGQTGAYLTGEYRRA